MDVGLPQALGPVKTALMETARKAEVRRLMVYGDKIPCRAGCSGCCSRYLTASLAEAVIMYVHLRESGLWDAVRRRAEELMPLVRSASPVAWFKMNKKCPVLDESGMCSGWAVRPAACSVHFVTSDPSLCDPWSSRSAPYVPLEFDDLFDAFQKSAEAGLEKNGILALQVPLPVGLLMAERISVRSGLSLDKAVSLIFNEL